MLLVSSDNSMGFLRLEKKNTKNSLLQSLSDCEQTDRERGDIDLPRLRIMFKSVTLGSRLVGLH